MRRKETQFPALNGGEKIIPELKFVEMKLLLGNKIIIYQAHLFVNKPLNRSWSMHELTEIYIILISFTAPLVTVST